MMLGVLTDQDGDFRFMLVAEALAKAEFMISDFLITMPPAENSNFMIGASLKMLFQSLILNILQNCKQYIYFEMQNKQLI